VVSRETVRNDHVECPNQPTKQSDTPDTGNSVKRKGSHSGEQRFRASVSKGESGKKELVIRGQIMKEEKDPCLRQKGKEGERGFRNVFAADWAR